MGESLHCLVSLVDDLKRLWEDRGLPVMERDTVYKIRLRRIMMCFASVSLARQGGCPLLLW